MALRKTRARERPGRMEGDGKLRAKMRTRGIARVRAGA